LNKKRKTEYRRKEYTLNDLLQRGTNTFFGSEYNGKKCPFLKNRECAIYVVRPYVCRRYIIFENDNTKCGYNSDEAISQYMCGITETSYENVIKHYLAKNPAHETNNVMFGDIREYFFYVNSV
jgi:Fe-S-cluster containining protein